MDDREKYGRKISGIGIGMNLVLASLKIIVGIISGMVSIVSDGINNLSDAAASIVTFVGFKMSSKNADEEHPFGHGRFEYIAGIVVAFLVMLAGFELLKTGIDKLVHPTDIDVTAITVAALVFSILVKGFMYFLYKNTGNKINSGSLIAAAMDSRNDVIATTAVLLTAAVYLIFKINIDGIMGVIVALFVIYSGIGLVRDTINPLLGTTPDPEFVHQLEEKILSYKGVLGTHDLMVHDYGTGRLFASAHVEVPAEESVLVAHEMIDRIEQDVQKEMGVMLVIHYDPIVTSDEQTGKIREYLSKCCVEIYDKLTIHDLRIVPGEENTNVIFDCVVPASCPVDEDEVVRLMKEKLAEKYPNHTAIIKIDHSFVSLN